MTASLLVDGVKILVTSTGTGALSLGEPVPSFRGVEALTNGSQYSYAIQVDGDYEWGTGTYLSTSQTLTRSPMWSSQGGVPLDLPANAQVSFVALAEDLYGPSYATAAQAAAIAAEDSADRAETALAEVQGVATTGVGNVYETWDDLSAVTPTEANVGAIVIDSDTGTHTDPVTSATVANAGIYTSSLSPVGWKWIGESTAAATLAAKDLAQAWAESDTAPDPDDPDSKSAKTIATELEPLIPIVGYYTDTPEGVVLAETDANGNASRVIMPDGTNHIAGVSVAPYTRDDPVTLVDGDSGEMRVQGAAGFGPSPRQLISEVDLSGTEWEGSADITMDANGYVQSVLWNDGTAQSTVTGGGGTTSGISLIDLTSLPDSAHPNANGGFTCTGLSRIGATGQFANCWVVGNDGRLNEASSTFYSSVIILSPDFRRIVREFIYGGPSPVIAGIQSIQGVAWDESDDTIWFIDKTNGIVRHIDMTGALLGDAITKPAGSVINGLTREAATDCLWLNTTTATTLYRVSCVDGSIQQTLSGGGIRNDIDHLHYDADRDLIFASYGVNGVPGSLLVINPDTAVLVKGFTNALTYCEAIEGIFVDGNTLYGVNDGAFHDNAKPPLALAGKYSMKLGA